MKFFTYLDRLAVKSDEWSDYLLPSAIYESKQLVNSIVFSSVFFIGSIIFLFIALGLYAFPNENQLGPWGYICFSCVMDVGLIVVIPIMLFQNMSNERASGSFEHMTITAITPLKIVLGKWQSGIMQCSVFGSIALPGLIYSYFFNGIALLAIFFGLILTALASQFAIMVALFFSSIGMNKISRLFFHLISTIAIILIFSFNFVIKYQIIFSDDAITDILSVDFILPFFAWLIFIFSVEAFLLFVCTARISPFSSNKSSLPRVFYSLIVLEMTLIIIFLKIYLDFNFYSENIILFLFIHCLITFFFLTESDELQFELLKKLNRHGNPIIHFIKRFFYPGRSSAIMLFFCQSLFIMIALVFSNWEEYHAYNMSASTTIGIVNCFVFNMSIIYLFFCIQQFYLKQPNILHFSFIGIAVILINFIFPYLLRMVFPDLGDFASIMNFTLYLQTDWEWEWIQINCTITIITLLIALTVTIIKDNRKLATTRNYMAGERGDN